MGVETFKTCTPLWHEAHVQVRMDKADHSRSTFGSWVVKKCRCCGAKHVSEVKMLRSRTIFGSWDVEKVHAVVARSTFRSQNAKTPHVRTTFGRWTMDSGDSALCQKWAKQGVSKHLQKTMADVGRFKRIWATLHYTTLHDTTLHSAALHFTTLHDNYNYNCNCKYNYSYTTLH